MANNLKTLGLGVFGLNGFIDGSKATATNLGFILSGAQLTYEGDEAQCINGFGSVEGNAVYNSRASITLDGYYTSSTNIPKVGDIFEFIPDTNGISLPDLTIDGGTALIEGAQISTVDITATNTDYVTVSISAMYYPLLDYTPAP